MAPRAAPGTGGSSWRARWPRPPTGTGGRERCQRSWGSSGHRPGGAEGRAGLQGGLGSSLSLGTGTRRRGQAGRGSWSWRGAPAGALGTHCRPGRGSRGSSAPRALSAGKQGDKARKTLRNKSLPWRLGNTHPREGPKGSCGSGAVGWDNCDRKHPSGSQ